MFGKLFKKNQPEENARVVEQPEQLQIGDMVEMVDSFGLPELLRAETLQVKQVATYEFSHHKYPEFQLEGSKQSPVFMFVDNEDGKQIISFSIKISREDVEKLFDMDAFSSIFDEVVYRDPIAVIGDEGPFNRWLSKQYFQTSEWVKGYYYEKDYRNSPMVNYETKFAMPFETVSLSSEDGRHSVGIEVWEEGETDVSLELNVPFSEIKSFYARTKR